MDAVRGDVDEFEISIEQGSSPAPRRTSNEMPQIDPRIAVATAGVFILGLVMWLGAQTPARTATTTVETIRPTKPSMVHAPESPSPSELTEAARLPSALGIEEPLYVLITGQVYGSQLLLLESGGFSFFDFRCGGLPVAMILGYVGDDLVGVSGASACRFDSSNGGEVVGAYASLGLLEEAVGEDLSWFCDHGPASRWVSDTEYDLLREGVWPEPRCEANEPESLAAPEGSGFLVSPGEQYALLLPSVDMIGPSGSLAPMLIDLSSGEGTELDSSGDERFGPWLSDEHFIVRTLPSQDPRFSYSGRSQLPVTLSVSVESAVDGERVPLLNFVDWDILPRVQVVTTGSSDG